VIRIATKVKFNHYFVQWPIADLHENFVQIRSEMFLRKVANSKLANKQLNDDYIHVSSLIGGGNYYLVVTTSLSCIVS